jgi:hypothetical protein
MRVQTVAHERVADTLHGVQQSLDDNATGLRAPLYDVLSALDVLSARGPGAWRPPSLIPTANCG